MERSQHLHILGKTGTGKSHLMKQLLLNDTFKGHGVFYIDPHGSDCYDYLNRLPKSLIGKVVLFDPTDTEYPVGWNALKGDAPFVASSITDTFKDVWGYYGTPTPTLDQYIYNTTYSLIETGESLLGMKFMLTSPKYRKEIIYKIKDPLLKDFWVNDFEPLPDKDKRDTTRSTLNKIGLMLTDPRIRNTIGQKKSGFDFKDILEKDKIFVARLPQGKLGLQKTSLLGTLLLSQFHLACLDRTSKTPFSVFLDEGHNFACHSLVEMLSGIRKYGVQVHVIHQYLDQLPKHLKDSIIGTIGQRALFRISIADNYYLDDIVGQDNIHTDLHLLPNYFYRTTLNGKPNELEVSNELPVPQNQLENIIEHNRKHNARHISKVQKELDYFLRRV